MVSKDVRRHRLISVSYISDGREMRYGCELAGKRGWAGRNRAVDLLNSRKLRRRHADDRIGEILDRKRLTDDFFIRVKPKSPIVKAQNDNGGTVWSFIIAWSKEMAENWPCAEDGEIRAGHELSVRRRSSPNPLELTERVGAE